MSGPTDPRRHQRETERNLIIGAAVIFVVVGGGLIYLFYGGGAMFSGVFCLGGAVLIFALLYLILKLFERIGGE